MEVTLKRILSILAIVLLVCASFSPITYAEELALSSKVKVEGLNHEVQLSKEDLEKQRSMLEQLETIEGPATIASNLDDVSGQVDVIVHYRTPSVGLAKGLANAKGKRFTGADESNVKNEIAKQQLRAKKERKLKKIQAKENRTYSLVLNAEALTVDAKDIEKLAEIKDVALVEKDEVLTLDPEITALHKEESKELSKPENDVSTELIPALKHLEIEKVWELGNKGKGIKVGVIDTGIDYNHPDLKDVYKGGRNYVNGSEYKSPRADDDPYETDPADRPQDVPEEQNGSEYFTTHGTHVAGTIAAQGNNEYGVTGVAPNVDLYAYRVLGAYGSGYTNWIVAGIEDAVKDGMDVINLSLGNSSPDESQANSFAVNNAMLLGTVAVSATGNSGPERSTVGGPASGALGIGVGNTTLPELKYYSDITLESGDYKKELKDVLYMTYTINEKPENQFEDSESVVVVPNAGTKEDFKDLDIKGKVALIQRGEIPFVEKILNAKEAGAKGVIIYNSKDGSGAPGPTDLFLGKSFEYLPTLDLSYTDGAEFKEAIDKNGEGTVEFNAFNSEVNGGDEMNDSSSRGPSTPNFDIKPDVSAPGTNILSTIPVFKSVDENQDYTYAYAEYTGTSMATPHIAGISALVLELNPDYTPFDVKSALSNTAKLMDTSKFDVFDQGAGLVQPFEAATTKSLFKVNHETEMDGKVHEHTRGTLSYGIVEDGETATKDLIIENKSGNNLDYNIEVETLSDAGVTVKPSQSSVSTADNASIEINLEVPEGVAQGTEVQGFIHITSGEDKYSVPFAASIGEPQSDKAFKSYELEDYHISPNGDNVLDETKLNIEFASLQSYTLVQYYDLLNPKAGPDKNGYVGTLDFLVLSKDHKELIVDGSMYNLEDNKRIPGEVEDGVYTIDSVSMGSNQKLQSEFDGPLFIKRNATEITDIKVVDNNLDISIDDLYVSSLDKLKELYNLTYDPNSFVIGNYTLNDGQEEITGSGQFTEDGKFVIEDKLNHAYHLTVEFEDAAGNSKSYKYTVNPKENVVEEGHNKLPEVTPEPDPEPEPEPEGPTDEGKISIDPNDYSGLFENGKKNVVVDLSEYDKVQVELDNEALKTLSNIKKNKSLELDLDGYGVKFNVDNFKEIQSYEKVYVDLAKSSSEELSDQLTVKLIAEQNGEQVELDVLDSQFEVLLPTSEKKVNVLHIDTNELFKGNGLFDKKQQKIKLPTQQFGAYVIVEQ